VEEVVKLTLEFYKRNYIEGLFLSSGIIQNSDYTMEQLTAVAKTLRSEHGYGGYIHLKTIPNASQALIEDAGRWADRLSVNIELPTERDLHSLAPEKNKPQIVGAMSGIRDKINEQKAETKAGFKAPRFAPAGQSTQMIVGATETPDADVLKTASELYTGQRLRRVYYSAYSPIPHADARLPGQSPPLVREHRLYQADWLMRFYGFDANEIVSVKDRNLSLDIDPKLAWALANRHFFPVDVNRASREELLRIPGIGVRNVKRILQIRKFQGIRTADLKKLRVAWNRAKVFVITGDHNPALADLDKLDLKNRVAPPTKQLMLFDAASSSASGEV
jgi:putative DNA modification/repair radical SAM protein